MTGRLIAVAVLVSCISAALAQTTAPTTRRTVVAPPGFARVQAAGGVVALCEPADEPWVRQVIENLEPATRPTTGPADLLERTNQHRAAVAAALAAALALENDARALAMFDEKLIPTLSKLRELDPPIQYLVTTRSKLKDLLRSGEWDDPRFYYNRAADDVAFNMSIPLTIEREPEETVLPALYQPEDSVEVKSAKLRDVVRNTQANVLASIARRGHFIVQMNLIEFVADEVFQPMNLKTDQAWIGLGAAGALAAKHAATIIGVEKDQIVAQMTYEDPRNPVRTRGLDLLDPTDPKDLRKNIVPLYIDAMRRKSTLVIDRWISADGTDPLARTIRAMKQTMPEDGEGLVTLIRETTGKDLSAELSAQSE